MPDPAASHPATVLVTGGAGFIGSTFVLGQVARGTRVINLDKLTYAGDPDNLLPVARHPDHVFVHGDIADRALVERLLDAHRPAAIVNFAAESHVDRSIASPDAFVHTNVVGVLHLLEASRAYVDGGRAPRGFRFVQVSTDEVYGSIAGDAATEDSPHAPNSPYAASKAGGDALARAWHHTYGLDVRVTHCSNNYGPRQFPEKLIPVVIRAALAGAPIPVYGDGAHVRDWLYVEDHCDAVARVLDAGAAGRTYNIAAGAGATNLETVDRVCQILDVLAPDRPRGLASYRALRTFVADRPGHDRRYALDATRIRRELGWAPRWSLADGLRATVAWYLAHPGRRESIATPA